jgi:alpha-tubulin suppressor-like RCC1 family protein
VLAWIGLGVSALGACTSTSPAVTADAGAGEDGGSNGNADASMDADGSTDAGMAMGADASFADSGGTADAGSIDSGGIANTADAGPLDSGVRDAGVDAPDPGGATAVSVGGGKTCALTRGGAVACWINGLTSPTQVAGLPSGATAVSAGGNATSGQYGSYGDFACAITAGGGVDCWGDTYSDGSGVLGGSNTPNSAPGAVPGLSGVTALSTGAGDVLAACAVASGTIRCWGNNAGNPTNGTGPGILGDGTSAASSSAPVEVAGVTGTVTAISVGSSFACAIAGGGVWCWGNNAYGQLGNDSTTNSAAPVPVTGLTSGVTAVSTGDDFACALTAAGAVECWGYNGGGQLGSDSDAGSSLVPVPVTGLASGVTAVSVAAGTACALTASGAVECWGANAGCELGNNSTMSSPLPVQVAILRSGVTALSVGNGFACAITSDGGVWCWGTVNVNGAGEGVAPECVPIHVTGFPG